MAAAVLVAASLLCAGFGCSTCPTGICGPPCTITDSVALDGADANAPAALLYSGFDLAVAYHDNAGSLSLVRLTTDGTLRGEPTPVGGSADAVSVEFLGEAYGVITAGPGPTTLHRIDPAGAVLDSTVLTPGEVASALATTDAGGGFLLGWVSDGVSFVQRFDDQGAPFDPTPQSVGPTNGALPVDLAVAADGGFGFAGTDDTGTVLAATLGVGTFGDDLVATVIAGADAVTGPGLASFGEGLLVAWGSSGGVIGLRELPDGANRLQYATDGAPVEVVLTAARGDATVLAWLQDDDGALSAWFIALGPDGGARGDPTVIGTARTLYGAVPTPSGAALLHELETDGGRALTVTLLTCD